MDPQQRLLLERGAAVPRDDESLDGAEYREGDVVEARYQCRDYYPGKVSRDHGNGKYDITYDHGDKETGVDARLIRKLLRSPLAIARREGHAEIVALVEDHRRSRIANRWRRAVAWSSPRKNRWRSALAWSSPRLFAPLEQPYMHSRQR